MTKSARAKFSFGGYLPTNSAIHALDPRVKFALSLACVYAAFACDTWVCLLGMSATIACVYAIGKIPLGAALCGLTPLAALLAFTVLFASFTLDPEQGTYQLIGSLRFDPQGLLKGLRYALRIALTVSAASVITFTTAPVQLVDSLLRMLRPLSRFGLPVEDICLGVSIVLRFIPLITDEAYAIRDAQMARGAVFGKGGPLRRVKAWTSVLIPLVVRLFVQADELARSLEARCYSGRRRTRLPRKRLTCLDWLVLAFGLVVFALLGIFG